jgi:hypothetical protein
MINIREVLAGIKPYVLGWIYGYLTDGGLDKLGIGRVPTTGIEFEVAGDASLDGGLVVNESGAAKNFRVESDTNAFILVIDGTTNVVGIGGAANASYMLKVTGDTWMTGAAKIDGIVGIGGAAVAGMALKVTGDILATGNLEVDGTAYIGDSANGKVTKGLTINQGAADDEILSLKSSDIAHGVTDTTETDTYGFIKKIAADTGGLLIGGLAETGVKRAIQLTGIATDADTTKSTAGLAPIAFASYLKSGSATTAVSADGNLAVIRNGTTTRFIFDAEGSAHADVEWIAFDDYDDLALLSDLQTAMKDPVKAEFAEFLQYNKSALEGAGIVRFDQEAPGHAMLNTTRLSMLLVGALRQMNGRLEAIENKLLQ